MCRSKESINAGPSDQKPPTLDLGDMTHVLVTPTRKADQDRSIDPSTFFQDVRDGMSSLQSRDDTLELGYFVECPQRLLIRDEGVPGPARVFEEGMFGSDSRVIQPRRHGVRGRNLTIRILQKIAERTVQDTGPSSDQ